MLEGEPRRCEHGPSPARLGGAPILVVRCRRIPAVDQAQQTGGVREIDPQQEVALGHGQSFREPRPFPRPHSTLFQGHHRCGAGLVEKSRHPPHRTFGGGLGAGTHHRRVDVRAGNHRPAGQGQVGFGPPGGDRDFPRQLGLAVADQHQTRGDQGFGLTDRSGRPVLDAPRVVAGQAAPELLEPTLRLVRKPRNDRNEPVGFRHQFGQSRTQLRFAQAAGVGPEGCDRGAQIRHEDRTGHRLHRAGGADVRRPVREKPFRQPQRTGVTPGQAADAQLGTTVADGILRSTQPGRQRGHGRRPAQHGEALPDTHRVPVQRPHCRDERIRAIQPVNQLEETSRNRLDQDIRARLQQCDQRRLVQG